MTVPRPSPALVRGLALTAAIAVIAANVIGTGVFLKARVMTCNVGTPGMVLLVWFVAGLLSLAGALTYAELGTMMPRSGGEYNFLGAAYGRRWAFLNGWMRTLIGQTGSQAAVAVACVIFLNDLLGGTLGESAVTYLPLVVIALGTALNLASVRASGAIATGLTAIKVALVVAIGVGGFLWAGGALEHFSMSGAAGSCEGVADSTKLGVAGFAAAMLAALWGYDGWNTLTHVAGEVRDPGKNIPRALIGGVLGITGLYLFVNAAYFYVLAPTTVASVPEASSVARDAAVRFFGPAVVGVMAAGLMASSFGTLHTSILAGARITYAMARDGLLPRTLGRVSEGPRVPAAAVILHGVWASLLALSGSFDTLTDYVVFGSWIFYGMAAAAVFVLRRQWPDAERPYKTWGYPVVPILFLLVTGFLLVTTLASAWPQVAEGFAALGDGRVWEGIRGIVGAPPIAGILLIAAGLPVYAYYARRAGPEPPREYWTTEEASESREV
jgi:APA family basic amino acid/polyamine antiporter